MAELNLRRQTAQRVFKLHRCPREIAENALREEARSIELILVDDASTDGTWERILQPQSADQRVRGIRHLQHAGQSAALWTGLSASQGAVLVTLDGDACRDLSCRPAA